jgi:pimeloyl-ACP methyl ester carboxylesterase
MSGAQRRLRGPGREAPYRSLTLHTPDGVRIAVQDWKRPTSGRDVLFIHGYSQSHLAWLKQVTDVLASEFRLVTYDLRGHGGSDQPLDPVYYREPERWAAEVETVIRGAGLNRPTLVCWSYAGRVALDYLGLRGDGDIAALALVSATSSTEPEMLGPAAPLLQQMTRGDLAHNIESTLNMLRACTAHPVPDDELRFMLAYNMVVPTAVRANMVGREASYEATLRALQIPVMSLHGSDDRFNLPAMAEYVHRTVRRSHRVLYQGVGHMPFWELPQAFDSDLAAFLLDLD